MAKGGARPGAGRPVGSFAPSTIQAQIQRHRLVVLLEDKVDGIFNALADKALDGDVPAAKELFDRAWGKPEQSLTVDNNINDKRKQDEPARIAAAKEYARVLKSTRTGV